MGGGGGMERNLGRQNPSNFFTPHSKFTPPWPQALDSVHYVKSVMRWNQFSLLFSSTKPSNRVMQKLTQLTAFIYIFLFTIPRQVNVNYR